MKLATVGGSDKGIRFTMNDVVVESLMAKTESER